MCAGPAKVYGIKNKGFLKEGFDGDLVLVDLEKNRTISDSDTWTRVGWTPYAGRSLTGWPMYTIVDGNIVHRRDNDGSLRGFSQALAGESGRPLRFN
jgi:dihydroorotase